MAIANNTPTGQDAIKGGIFFGSNLTPAGTFPNLPAFTTVNPPLTTENEKKLVLTLEQVKEELKRSAQEETKVSGDVLSNESINTYLTTFVQLLIDYRDLRNYVFFGSAYTELVYHINEIIKNYPYKSFIAVDINITPGGLQMLAISGSRTRVKFVDADILQPSIFVFDNSGDTIWTDYDLMDENNLRFPILEINAPMTITNVVAAGPVVTTTLSKPHNYVIGDTIVVQGVNGISFNGTFTIASVGTNTFTVNTATVGSYTGGGTVDLPTGTHFLVAQGSISNNNFIEWQPTITQFFKGLIISPKIRQITDFEINSPGEQKALLSPTNPTPWPREPITDNIITSGPAFDSWIEDTQNMVPAQNDDIGILNINGEELNLRGALALDEYDTNQLLRRAIPDKLVDELNDPDDKLFTRFVLIAGRFFDNIKVYIDFVKYVHSLNYTQYNHLSPEFYKQYAEHYGFDLFDDDNVDVAKAVVRTEPGLRYDQLFNAIFDNTAEAKTLRELQYEKQKRLLINLLHLYKTKGTQKSIKFLTSLLGAPEGLILLDEYLFNMDSGLKEVDNIKYNVPDIAYEVDPNYLVNPNNIFDPANLPYVFRLKLANENKVNLREIKIVTDPQGAIANEIINFGKTIYPYMNFKNGGFANLQDLNNPYYLLPLSIPDKFIGITVEYMLPKGGMPQLEANNLDEATIHIGSLYEVGGISYGVGGIPNPIAAGINYVYPVPAPQIDNIDGPTTIQQQGQLKPSPTSTLLSINNLNYIIARQEGRDLVIRANFRFEVPAINYEKRVAIMPNVFEADGLNHQLRLIYRPEGVEVYQDFKYLGLARWKRPFYQSGPSSFNYEPIDAPKELFPLFSERSLGIGIAAIKLFAYPSKQPNILGSDAPKWFDLFVGLPNNINMYFNRVSVFDSLGIDVPDTIDFGISTTGIENEKFSFSLQDQVINNVTLQKETDFVYTQCTFRAPNPDAPGANTTLENYFASIAINDKLSIINLSSKDYAGGPTQYLENVQGFYKLPNGQILTIDSLFKYNAWSPTLHEDYDYEAYYNEAWRNYEVFSNQVLTYLSLLPFIELIESKFQTLIRQFIPIVINLSEFGRLLRNNPFHQLKAHYAGIHCECEAGLQFTKAVGEFDLEYGFYYPGNNTITISISPLAPATFDWASTNMYTLTQIANYVNAVWNNYGISATVTNCHIKFEVDPVVWFSMTATDINTVTFSVAAGGAVIINNLTGFAGGQIPNTPDCDRFKLTRLIVTAPPSKPCPPFIYYNSENGLATYIYNASELAAPLYIN